MSRPAAPYTPAELAGLRAAAEHTDAQGMTRRLLATVAHLQELTGRYLEARDRCDPEGERQARGEIERWL